MPCIRVFSALADINSAHERPFQVFQLYWLWLPRWTSRLVRSSLIKINNNNAIFIYIGSTPSYIGDTVM